MTKYSAMQADEEQLLLDAIDMAGFGNWTAVSEHIGSKSKEECKVHPSCPRGIECVMLSTDFPLQDEQPAVARFCNAV